MHVLAHKNMWIIAVVSYGSMCCGLKFIFGLKFFELVSISFAIVPDYDNE